MDKLKHINKAYILFGGALLLLLVSYQLAFKKTLESWQLHRQLNNQLLQSTDVSIEPDYVNRKNRNIAQLLKNYQLDSAAFRTNTVNKIALMAEQEKVKLTGVPADDLSYHTPRFIAQKLTIEGDFFSLLKLVSKLQYTPDIGLLRSVSWKAPKANAGVPSNKLSLELILVISR